MKLTDITLFQRILNLSTAKDKSELQLSVAVEESLVHRINPSLNEVTKATIECSLYVPPGKMTVTRLIIVNEYHVKRLILCQVIVTVGSCGLDWYG